MEPVALTGVVRRDVVEARLQELGLLGGSLEAGGQDGLAAAALAEDGDLLCDDSLGLHLRKAAQGRLPEGSQP